jgi:predicted metal-dependent phosphoesterase TrpH
MTKIRADLHTHSHYSRDSVLSPEAYVDACVRKGITCAAVTDHNVIEGASVVREVAARKAPGRLKIITGEEIKTSQGEIIGLFLEDLVPRGLTAAETVRAIHDQGGIAAIPHPFDVFRRNVIKREVLDEIATLVDTIEGYNCRNILGSHDAKAREVARQAGKPISVGSDSHSRWEIGGAYIEMDDFETPQEFLEALARGAVHFRRSLPMVHWISTYAKIRWRLGLGPRLARGTEGRARPPGPFRQAQDTPQPRENQASDSATSSVSPAKPE